MQLLLPLPSYPSSGTHSPGRLASWCFVERLISLRMHNTTPPLPVSSFLIIQIITGKGRRLDSPAKHVLTLPCWRLALSCVLFSAVLEHKAAVKEANRQRRTKKLPKHLKKAHKGKNKK